MALDLCLAYVAVTVAVRSLLGGVKSKTLEVPRGKATAPVGQLTELLDAVQRMRGDEMRSSFEGGRHSKEIE